jgi:polyhydroxybutyrate depolymerase
MPRLAIVGILLALTWNAVRAADAPARQEWNVDGITREALVHVPAAAKTTASPVVFAFHGHGGTMRHAAATFAYHKHWPEATVVYMQGLNTPGILTDPEGKRPGWQRTFGDQDDRDLKFFDAVLATLKKDYKVDEQRIYATGHSNGGGFTYLLWAARGDVFAAVAPCAAAAKPDFKQHIKPKPVLHMAGADHRRTAENQRLRRGAALGRARHPVSVQERHARCDVHSPRWPRTSDGRTAGDREVLQGTRASVWLGAVKEPG